MKFRASSDPDSETGESAMDREQRRNATGDSASSGTSSGVRGTRGSARVTFELQPRARRRGSPALHNSAAKCGCITTILLRPSRADTVASRPTLPLSRCSGVAGSLCYPARHNGIIGASEPRTSCPPQSRGARLWGGPAPRQRRRGRGSLTSRRAEPPPRPSRPRPRGSSSRARPSGRRSCSSSASCRARPGCRCPDRWRAPSRSPGWA